MQRPWHGHLSPENHVLGVTVDRPPVATASDFVLGARSPAGKGQCLTRCGQSSCPGPVCARPLSQCFCTCRPGNCPCKTPRSLVMVPCYPRGERRALASVGSHPAPGAHLSTHSAPGCFWSCQQHGFCTLIEKLCLTLKKEILLPPTVYSTW